MVKPPLELKKRTLSTKQLQQSNQQLGSLGEKLAADYLLAKNYQILAQNIRLGLNEIDIIALDREFDELVFIEVKTRDSADFGHPNQAVKFKKIVSMRRVAQTYLKKLRLQNDYRFDIITVIGKNGNTIEHFENITWP